MTAEIFNRIAFGAFAAFNLWLGLHGLIAGQFDFRYKIGGALLTRTSTPGRYWLSVIFHLAFGIGLAWFALARG